MTFAYWTVLLVAILPLVWAGFAKAGAEGYDNARPRVFLAELTGWQQRANWAQTNTYEAFPPFAAGVIIAHMVGANQVLVDSLAGLFLVTRILHGILYIQDKATARSIVWTVGFFCVIGLFLAAGWAD
ncbi:MAG: MAPEG family protein [Gammaproteobacteria bacterium]|nr:MAPEG family protein [Gammaproteobacteria bacterium]